MEKVFSVSSQVQFLILPDLGINVRWRTGTGKMRYSLPCATVNHLKSESPFWSHTCSFSGKCKIFFVCLFFGGGGR